MATAANTCLEVSLYGGAIFTVVFESRDSTKDVDAIVRPSELSRKLAAQVAREQGLPEDWLNDDVRFFLADVEAKRKLDASEFGSGLLISVPTAAYLLAMKLRACRPPLPGYKGDYDDIEFLVGKIGIASLSEAEAIYDRFFPHDVLSVSASEIIQRSILKRIKP